MAGESERKSGDFQSGKFENSPFPSSFNRFVAKFDEIVHRDRFAKLLLSAWASYGQDRRRQQQQQVRGSPTPVLLRQVSKASEGKKKKRGDQNFTALQTRGESHLNSCYSNNYDAPRFYFILLREEETGHWMERIIANSCVLATFRGGKYITRNVSSA